MIDCRAIADPDDALSCELAECGFHDFMYMREEVASMIRAACPVEKLTQVKTPAAPTTKREVAAEIEKLLFGSPEVYKYVSVNRKDLKRWRQVLLA